MSESKAARMMALHAGEGPMAVWITNVFTALCKYSHKISSRPTGTYAVHDHPFYEMVYVVSGQVDFFIAGHVYPIGSGTLLTFPPGVRHGVLVRTDAPYERYTLHFDPRVLSMERRRLLLSAMPADLLGVVPVEQGENAVWRNMESSGVIQVLEAMETLRAVEQDKLTELIPIYVEAVLAALIPRAARERAAPGAIRRPLGQKEQIVSWVDQHYTEAISLDSLAERFYLSKGYLSALFRQATGSSLKDYVRARRMAHVQLLLSSGVPAAQAAARVGFGDYTTFYRAYVRTFGHAPSADCETGGRDALLEQALSVPQPDDWGSDAVLFPNDGTEKEDPSMQGAVRADRELLTGSRSL
ncbi:MAG: AraC family transcriptional regulator [Clostridia bacterium]|nr:AraC family transcriptional regulator [Clostridia bacterium]